MQNTNLSFSNAFRALLCMTPMVIAGATGRTEWIIPLGQGGFFNATFPLPKSIFQRVMTMVFTMAPGLGFYLIGGNSAQHVVYAVIFAFVVGVACGLLTGFRYLGMLAIAMYIPTYTAGLNAGSADKAANSFLAFSMVSFYCGLITLLPFWKTMETKVQQVAEDQRVLSGIKLGTGMAIALGISVFFQFGKLGWAPSAVGSVIRPDATGAKRRAMIRAVAVICGALLAAVVLTFAKDLQTVMLLALLLAVINGFISYTKLGQMPFLYNAVILILYSQTSTTPSKELIDTRILYNVIGVIIALAIVYYPLPILTTKVAEIFRGFESSQPPLKKE